MKRTLVEKTTKKCVDKFIETHINNNENLDHFFEMATLRKDKSKLPANLYLDDALSYKRGGHSKRLKFQPDKGDKPITHTFSVMTFDGEIYSSEKIELKQREINQIKNFLSNNLEALELLADMDIEWEEFKEIMIVGGKLASKEEKDNFLLKLNNLLENKKKKK